MSFLSPLWLLGLLPWGAVVYWLLQRRRRPTGVPFVALWRGPFHPPKPTRQFAVPPLAVALVMLAMLLAILSASRPAVRDPAGRSGKPIPVVLDRGAGMSAGAPRMTAALESLKRELLDAGVSPTRRVDLYAVPGGGAQQTDVAGLANSQPRTAADTRAAVAVTAARLLAEEAGLVIVVSDQPLGMVSDRLIQVPPPDGAFRNVGIVRIAARATPKPQVMVTLGGSGMSTAVRVRVVSDGVETAAVMDPPAEGQTRDAFIDVPKLGSVVEVLLDVTDDATADDRAWLVRGGSWPRIEARGAMVPAFQRLIESYVATRPPGEGAERVVIVTDIAQSEGPTVVVPGGGDVRTRGGELTVAPHPVTGNVDFNGVGEASVLTDPPAGWTAVVQRGGDVWVAVREAPARQVWVGFDAPQWARSPEYVVFWAGILDWLGRGGEAEYAASTVGNAGPDWQPASAAIEGVDATHWPGLLKRSDGAARAVNSGLVSPGPVASTVWKSRLPELQRSERLPLAPYGLLLALACLALAAAVWRRPSLTEISGKTTVAADGVLTEARAARAEAISRPITTNQDV